MVELAQKDPEMFEQKRIELINDAIDRCSGPQREALRKLQTELDEVRRKQPERFLQACFSEIADNLERSAKLWTELGEKVNEFSELVDAA